MKAIIKFRHTLCKWLVIIAVLINHGNGKEIASPDDDDDEPWTGRWMPDRPTTETTVNLHDKLHGIKMGVVSSECDDGKTNLTVDWDYSPEDYTCFTSSKIVPNYRIKPILECEHIPKYYVARHECMNKSIHYDVPIPTFGTHRPLWAKYGEYKYLPKQRWLHNLEHGAVVMLYHPCANPVEVNQLRKLVTGCLRRHVISPFSQLDEYRPLALVTWGCRLTMSSVEPNIVIKFIKQHALKGYEHTAREGQFDLGLQVPAKVVSDLSDSVLCPL